MGDTRASRTGNGKVSAGLGDSGSLTTTLPTSPGPSELKAAGAAGAGLDKSQPAPRGLRGDGERHGGGGREKECMASVWGGLD